MTPPVLAASLAKLWLNRLHESNWFKTVFCRVVLHRERGLTCASWRLEKMLDSWIKPLNRNSSTLEGSRVDMHIEALDLEAGEVMVWNRVRTASTGSGPFFLGCWAKLVAQEAGEFFVRFKGTPKISLMRWAVSRHKPISQLHSMILCIGKWRLKMKLRLGQSVEAGEVYLAAFFLSFWENFGPSRKVQ